MTRIIYFIIIFFCISCNKGNDKASEPLTSSLKDLTATIVQIKLAEEKPFEYLIHVPGKIRPQREAKIHIKSDEPINKVMIANGSVVKAGQIIALLENAKQLLNLEKAQATLEEKKILYEDQKLSYQSSNDSLIRKQQLANIRYTSGIVTAELAYKQAVIDFEQTKIKSPIDGIVAGLMMKEHNPVDASQPAVIIYSNNNLMAECFITESDAILIKKGFPATIELPGLPSVKGSVVDIDRMVNDKTGLVKMQVLIASNTGFFPGMSVEVTIKVPFQKSLMIPKEAVVIKNGKPVVFTEEHGQAKWNYINTGRENGKEIEVLSGLTAGQRTIVTNNLQLAHDAPVLVTN